MAIQFQLLNENLSITRRRKMKKKTKKFILEFLDFWPLTIVVPLMLIGILLGAALGWGG